MSGYEGCEWGVLKEEVEVNNRWKDDSECQGWKGKDEYCQYRGAVRNNICLHINVAEAPEDWGYTFYPYTKVKGRKNVKIREGLVY